MKASIVIAAGLLFLAPLANAGEHAHWSYRGKTGPEHWAQLEGGNAVCALGKSQSPVNIETGKSVAGVPQPVKFDYTDARAAVINNGHTIQVEPANAGAIMIDGTAYKLAQFHFHTPSEERIDGKAYPLVAHLVHKSDEGKLAVVAVLFRRGKANETLQPVLSHLPAKAGEKRALAGPINVGKLLPADHASFQYMGSLTTPPCTEDVRWIVLKTPVDLASSQLAAFRKLFPMNARPTQPLNGREVRAGS